VKTSQDIIERIIIRRLFEERLDGYTFETAKEIAEAISAPAQSAPEPVAWQVFHEVDGWGPCHSSDLAHYKKYGVKTRPLYASPTDAGASIPHDPQGVISEAQSSADSEMPGRRPRGTTTFPSTVLCTTTDSAPIASVRHGWPRQGDKMIFLGKNGYDYQLEAAKKIFNVGQEYMVERCDVGDWSHSIKFYCIDGLFNGVMFEASTVAPQQRGGGK
jgi:hypothetical protein